MQRNLKPKLEPLSKICRTFNDQCRKRRWWPDMLKNVIKPMYNNNNNNNKKLANLESLILHDKGISIKGHKGPRGIWSKGPLNHSYGTGSGTLLFVCSAAFIPRKAPYSFCRRLIGPQDQSGHEGTKDLYHSDTWDRTRTLLFQLPGPSLTLHIKIKLNDAGTPQ